MKSGLDYFPLDTVLDTKCELIEAEYGLKGFAVFIKLLQNIYGENGYYMETNDEVSLLFARKCGVGGSDVSEIISACVRRGIFDKELYSEYGVLTSLGIQKRYVEAARKRKEIVLYQEYLLGDFASNYKNVAVISKKGGIFEEKGGSFQQSKVKESKVKESKYIDCPEQSSEPAIALPLSDGSIYMLTAKEIQSYKKIYPDLDVTKEAKKAAKWLENNPKRRKTKKGIKTFIGSWMAKADEQGGSPELSDKPNYSDSSRYVNERSDSIDDI